VSEDFCSIPSSAKASFVHPQVPPSVFLYLQIRLMQSRITGGTKNESNSCSPAIRILLDVGCSGTRQSCGIHDHRVLSYFVKEAPGHRAGTKLTQDGADAPQHKDTSDAWVWSSTKDPRLWRLKRGHLPRSELPCKAPMDTRGGKTPWVASP